MAVFWRTQRESFAPLYWTMVICNFVLPLVLMGIRHFRTITGCVIASLGVIVGMWLERFLIIVPSLGHKYLPYSFGIYRPQPVEIIIAVATFAAMTLLYVAVRQGRADHLDLGVEGGRAHAARVDSAVDTSTAGRAAAVEAATAMKAIYGLYGDGQSAQQAVNRLRAAGVCRPRDHRHVRAADGGLRVRPHRTSQTWMWWIACAGGLLGHGDARSVWRG